MRWCSWCVRVDVCVVILLEGWWRVSWNFPCTWPNPLPVRQEDLIDLTAGNGILIMTEIMISQKFYGSTLKIIANCRNHDADWPPPTLFLIRTIISVNLHHYHMRYRIETLVDLISIFRIYSINSKLYLGHWIWSWDVFVVFVVVMAGVLQG